MNRTNFISTPLGSYFTLNNTLITYEDILWKVFEFSPFQVRAEAYCKPPCQDNHYKLFHNDMCCWTCKRCKHNEIASKNRTMCSVCPHLSWPQEEPETNSMTCVEIVAQELDLSSSIIICFLFLAAVCMLATCLLGIKFCFHKNQIEVIQDTENILIFGCITSMLGYLTVPIYVFKSTDIACNVATVNFIANFTSMYTAIHFYSLAILKKDIHIRPRSSKLTKLPWPLVTAGFFLILNGSYVIIVHTRPIQALKHQPVLGESLVELTCDIYEVFFVPFYLFTLAILTPAYHCAYLSCSHVDTTFQSRTIRNFITWTCIVWTAFLPAYHLTMSRIIKMHYLLGAIIGNNIMMFYTLVNVLYGQKIWNAISGPQRFSLSRSSHLLIEFSSIKEAGQRNDERKDTSTIETSESILSQSSALQEGEIKHESIQSLRPEPQEIDENLVDSESLNSVLQFTKIKVGSRQSLNSVTQHAQVKVGSRQSFLTQETNNMLGSQESSKPGSQESSKPGSKESSKPGSKESSKPGSQESSKPGSKESSKPGSQESSKPGSKESSKPGSQESSKPGSKESSKPGSQESSKPGSKESSKPGSKESSNPGSQESSKPGSKESSKPGLRESSKPGSQESSQPGSKESSKPGSQESSKPSTQETKNSIG
ncbi:uncharacterized protein LOC131941953 [Physella acuta]|uniref:uncharacterized protein LOC131941953 n=1 Tax=Physella acuta TaxID=109671 RepID=UPI0027DD4CCE|nr:uncharacterized protein LOC131941953 [Physella acuta]